MMIQYSSCKTSHFWQRPRAPALPCPRPVLSGASAARALPISRMYARRFVAAVLAMAFPSRPSQWLGGFLWYLVPLHVGGAIQHSFRGHAVWSRIVPGVAGR